MAQVTLQVVVKDQQVSDLQKKISQLSNTQITITVNDGTLKNFNTRLNTAAKRSQELSASAQDLQTRLGQVGQAFQNDTKKIQDNTEALKKNRGEMSKSRKASQEHNDDLKKQGVLYDILGRSLGSFLARMTAYRAVYAGIRAITNGFKEALNTLKAVDDELVTVRKVTGFDPAQMAQVESQAYAVASKYGANAADYVSGVAAFARAGYKELSGDLAELAQKTQIVGDTTAEVANQFLLSVDAAYKYNGSVEQLTRVLDGANEIDNKYATSIQKIAEGMGIVAPVAAQMHVSVDELAASIGTITAVTQRSGTETARALRALFLNIVGDTKTEIEEGVTWTTGEIEGLRDVIKTYAKDAYDAAQATGSIIDPMKAMEGLARSLKDGVLSEQKLMEMVSDIGGKLRTSQLLALINNWDMYESMLQDYRNAYGSADKEIENAMDSWTRKTNVLKNTWTEFIKTGLDSSVIKGALDALTSFVNGLDSLPAVLTRLLALVVTFNLPSIVTRLQTLWQTIRTGNITLTATQGILAALVIAWSAVSFAVEKHKQAIDEEIQAQREATRESAASISQSNERMRQLEELRTKYAGIARSVNTEAEEEKALKELKSDLVSVYNLEEDAISRVNDLRRDGISLISEENRKEVERALALGAAGYNDAMRRRNNLGNDNIFGNGYVGIDAARSYADILSRYGVAYELSTRGYDKSARGSDEGAILLTGDIESRVKSLTDLINALQAKGNLSGAEQTVFSIASKELSALTDELNEINPVIEGYTELMARAALYQAGFGTAVIESADDVANYKEWLKQTWTGSEELLEVMLRLVDEAFPQFKEAVDETTSSTEAETRAFWDNQDALKGDEDATKRLAAAKADAEAAVRNLIPALFDENGELTEAGRAALEASDYLADLTAAEINLQNEIARANYANIRAQLAALSTDAVKAAMSIIAAYSAAQAAREMGHHVGNLGYDRDHLPAGTFNALDLLRQLEALESTINSTTIQATAVSTYGTGARSSGSSGRSSGGSGRSSGSSGSGRSSGTSSSTTEKVEDATLAEIRERIALLRSELALLNEKDAPVSRRIEKMREIMRVLHEQAEYLRSIGASQTEINELSTEWWKYQNQINSLLEKEAQTAEEAAEAREREAEAIERARQAQEALNNALSQRNVHFYNSLTGQWEWMANPSSVASARSALSDAVANLPASARAPFLNSMGTPINSNLISTVNGHKLNYGPTYNIGGITISEAEARAMSVFDLLQLSKTLGIFNKTN